MSDLNELTQARQWPDSADTHIALVLAGGMALGAYQGGAYEKLHAAGTLSVDWLAGSSVGAVNAALIAGSRPDDRIETLRRFWNGGDLWTAFMSAAGWSGELRHVQNWLSVLQTRVFGAAGHFRPRLSLNPMKRFESLYDLTPMRKRLATLVDFDRLNNNSVRVSVAATDVETGELVVFDTGAGTRIGMEHLLASCGFLPEFAPVQIDGRLLGDGGLYANAPVEIVLNTWTQGPIFVVDLFASEGTRPASLEAALERKNDLIFGNQTLRFLNAYAKVVRPDPAPIVYLSYRPSEHEAGPEKTFDLSRATISDRWKAGMLDMKHALHRITAGEGLPALMTIRRPC
jgi:NTE family protein